MPYILKEVREGYKVCKRDEPTRCFSKDPLPKERAVKQRTAIILSEMGRSRPVATAAKKKKPVGGSGLKK